MVTMATAVIAAFVLLLSLSCSLAAPEAAPPPSTVGCTDELISFSACLSYVSDSPNNLTDSAPAKCCHVFSSAVESGSAICLCYFVRYPNILGFPLNTTRLLSLSSICASPQPHPPPSTSPSPSAPLSLNFLCSASPALPPLNRAEPVGNAKSGGGGEGTAPKFGGDARSRRGPGLGFYLSNGAVATSPHLGGINSLLMLANILALLYTV